jgi:chromosome segregation ATPase
MRECDKKINDLENNFENELRELRVKLRDYDNVVKEKMRLHTHVVVLEEEEKKIRGQNKEMMLQLSETRKRINNLEEQILKQEEEYEKSLENLEKKMRQREGVGGLERGNSSRGEGSFDEFGSGEDEEEDEREEKTEEEKEEKEAEKQKRKTSMKSPTAAAGAAATLENEIRLLKEQNDLLLREKETFLKEMASLNETSSPHPQLFPSSVTPHSPPQVTTTTDSTAILTEFVIPIGVTRQENHRRD